MNNIHQISKFRSFEMLAYRNISGRERNYEVLKMANEQLYIIPIVKKINFAYFVRTIIRRNNTHMPILKDPLEGIITRGRVITEWMSIINDYQRIDGNEIRRPRETGSRSGAMKNHNSPPY